MTLFETNLITHTKDLLAIGPEWNDLLERSHIHNIFLSWEWLSTWYQFIGKTQQLWLITARNKNNGQLVAVAPLMLQRRKIIACLSLSELCFMGNNVGSDHLDFILDQQYTEPLINELSTFIKNQNKPWDLIHLESSRNNANSHRILGALSNHTYSYSTICPYLSLPTTWADYLKSLSKKRRYKIGAYRRKLEKRFPGKVSYQCVKTIEELDTCLPSLFNLHQQAQQAQGRKGIFADQSLQSFHKQICYKFLENDWLRLYFLRVDNTPIAVVYSFFNQGTVSFYTTGFDLQWSDYSPGQQIIYYAIEQSINEKAVTFDFLRGDESYKFMMTKTNVENQRFIVPHTLLGKGLAWTFKQKKMVTAHYTTPRKRTK